MLAGSGIGGSRVEEEVRGTVVCWDMVVFCFFFVFSVLVFSLVLDGSGKREVVVEMGSITRKEREKFVTMLFCHLDYLYLL